MPSLRPTYLEPMAAPFAAFLPESLSRTQAELRLPEPLEAAGTRGHVSALCIVTGNVNRIHMAPCPMPGHAPEVILKSETIFDEFAAGKHRTKLYRCQSRLTLRGVVGRR